MGNKFITSIGENARQPSQSFTGWFLKTFMEKNNELVEKEAVKLCEIQPHHQVLEVGFGPGIGLKEAFNYVKSGEGMLHGVDFSSYMHKTAEKRLAQEIESGKVSLNLSSVMDMPFDSNKFDRVFHCNCYYFWDPMNSACAEIYRVMKPNSVMVTTLDWKAVQEASQPNKPLHGRNVDMYEYKKILEETGFKDVRIENLDDKGRKYEAIFAYVHEKPEINDDDKKDHSTYKQ